LPKLPRYEEGTPSGDEDDEGDHPLTPRTLSAALPPTDPDVKPATATKAPFSHPIALEASASPRPPLQESPGFHIAAVPAAPAAPPAGEAPPPPPAALPAETAAEAPAAAAEAPPPPPPALKRLSPSQKLLKRLPDQPVECTKLPDGPEPVAVDIEYLPAAQLAPVAGAAAAALAAALAGMAAPEWLVALEALTSLRRLVAHHAGDCRAALPQAVPLVVKSVRSLRSALCKTAIMTATDLCARYGDALLPLADAGGAAAPAASLLAQVLFKAASNDKRFVIEEAQRALEALAEALPPAELLPLLVPYTEHKNPKVRGRAAGVAAAAAARLSPSQAAAHGLPQLLKAAGRLITDNTPEARDAAKRLAACVKAAMADAEVAAAMGVQVPAPPAPAEGEEPQRQATAWEHYCQTTLGASQAAAVLRAVE
jgi:hypothetical protein